MSAINMVEWTILMSIAGSVVVWLIFRSKKWVENWWNDVCMERELGE